MSESDEDVILSSQKLFSTLFEENSDVLVPQVPDSEVEALSYLAGAFAWQKAKCQNCQKDVICICICISRMLHLTIKLKISINNCTF